MKPTISVLSGRRGHRRHRLVHVEMVRGRFGTRHGQFSLTLHLGTAARALLRHHHDLLHVTVTIVLPGISTRKVDALLSG
jgi:hypothetical protein